jgi:sarcosine oxidase subunit gamma
MAEMPSTVPHFSDAAVRIGCATPRAKVGVQCRDTAGSADAFLIPALGQRSLPDRVGETVRDDTLQGATMALCTGPTDWLIVSAVLDATGLCQQLGGAAPEGNLIAVDLTHGLGVLEVSGPATRELLAKGCGVDMHPASFEVRRCRRTRLAQLSAIIYSADDVNRFEIYVARSYLAYLHSWLSDAAVEFLGSSS